MNNNFKHRGITIFFTFIFSSLFLVIEMRKWKFLGNQNEKMEIFMLITKGNKRNKLSAQSTISCLPK